MSEFRKRGYLTQEEAMSLASYPSQELSLIHI